MSYAAASSPLLWLRLRALYHDELLPAPAVVGKSANRDLFLRVLEQVRRRYFFVVIGYVVMPEHVHLLIGEPERANPSVVLQAVKQGFARGLARRLRMRIEKLLYMHRNPVKRGLVLEAAQWRWSSFRHYEYGERGPVLVNEQRPRGELRRRTA